MPDVPAVRLLPTDEPDGTDGRAQGVNVAQNMGLPRPPVVGSESKFQSQTHRRDGEQSRVTNEN